MAKVGTRFRSTNRIIPRLVYHNRNTQTEVVTHADTGSFLELINCYHATQETPELLGMFNLLDSRHFIKLLKKFINEYVYYLKPRNAVKEEDWMLDLVLKYDEEIHQFEKHHELVYSVRTMGLIDFTILFMEWIYDAGIKEIYKRDVLSLKVSKHGKVNIIFDGADLPHRRRSINR